MSMFVSTLPPEIREVLRTRADEAMALNDRHLNPQLGRIVRTLGFDRTWVAGEGAHLIDDRGDRYLDLLCGYGVFAVGRNHPDVVAALQDVMAARTANLPQLGVSLLPGVLAERAGRARAGEHRRDGPGQQRRRGGRGRDEARPRRHGTPAHRCTPNTRSTG